MEKIKKQIGQQKTICLVILFFILFFLFSSPVSAQTAILYFSPATGSYTVGSTFAVDIYVSSTDQSINAVSGTVSFSPESLQVDSLSESGSIIDTWVQQPAFSNSNGTIDFQGIVLNPGFIGASGEIITINFEVKSASSALVNLLSGSVLANDGSGTDILSSLGSAHFSLSAAPPIAPPAPIVKPKAASPVNTSAPTILLPPAPQISSPTNPDPNKWYNNNTPKFVWQLTPDIISVRALFNKYPNTRPTIIYTPPISERDITTDLKDGIYYFHLQFENSAGWGPVSNFRFQIDTTPPEPFVINLVDGEETDNPRPTISFSTTDALSGIDYYKIKINDGNFFTIPQDQITNNSYVLPLQTPGPKSILILALDKAGNYTPTCVEFTIKSITPPVITDYPKELEDNEVLTLKGNTYPDSQIIIWHQAGNEEAESWYSTSDDQGNFTLTTAEKLENGDNKIWAQVIDKRGAKSDNSTQITIIEQESIFFTIKSWITDNIITAFLCLLLFVILLVFSVIHIYSKKKRHIKSS